MIYNIVVLDTQIRLLRYNKIFSEYMFQMYTSINLFISFLIQVYNLVLFEIL